jgi:hypothetical protein
MSPVADIPMSGCFRDQRQAVDDPERTYLHSYPQQDDAALNALARIRPRKAA